MDLGRTKHDGAMRRRRAYGSPRAAPLGQDAHSPADDSHAKQPKPQQC